MKKKTLHLQYNSPAVLSFALVSLGVLLLNLFTHGRSNVMLFSVYRSSLLQPLTYPRFFLHVLGHANFTHYISNMMLILVVGPPLEEKYGSRTMLECIAVTAFITGLFQWLLFPGTAVLGASGIVFMMILLGSMGGVTRDGIPLTLILVAVFYIGGEIVALTTSDNISQLSHILGGLCGAVFGFLLRKK
jgi:membrane associated rhomboid family serine protease